MVKYDIILFRRRWIMIRKILITLVFIVILFSVYNYIQISKHYINKLKLTSSKLNEPLRITQITDFHSNQNINLNDLFEDVKAFNPQIGRAHV